MQLIGMLDSPYVRRAAVSMRLLGLAFEHRSISVFSTFEQFRQINPVVKAPTLVCDDGTLLMDSTLIIEHAESLAGRSLMPADPAGRRRALRVLGLALAACEKTVQIVYERKRPREKQYAPWLERVQAQLAAAYAGLEAEARTFAPVKDEAALGQAELTSAVAWGFTRLMMPEAIAPSDCPSLAAFAAEAEKLPAFVALPPV